MIRNDLCIWNVVVNAFMSPQLHQTASVNTSNATSDAVSSAVKKWTVDISNVNIKIRKNKLLHCSQRVIRTLQQSCTVQKVWYTFAFFF